MIEIIAVDGLPEVVSGDDLGMLIASATQLRDGDVVVVAQKIVSKAEGALVDTKPGEDRAAARRRVARAEAVRVVCDAPFALIVQTRHGLVCANAGIDASNVPDGRLALLPNDPDGSSRRLRARLAELTGAKVAVIVSDTFGRPWRLGQTDVAIGVSGLRPIRDERGGADRGGVPLEVTVVAVADELAAAADLVRRKADGVPVVVIRGFKAEADDRSGAGSLVRPADEDLFPHGRGWLADALAADGTPGQGDMERAIAAGHGACRGLAQIVERGSTVTIRALGESAEAGVAVGVATGALVAALLDLGYTARWRPVDGAATVVDVAR
ncbi:MAG: coenzyme F420-0:L-glutamate ligase [Egibacteraceae bacterium]